MSTINDIVGKEEVVTGTVLVVDDDQSVLEPAQALLELKQHSTRNGENFNWRVYTASNPYQALDIAMRFRPGVAVVDLNYVGFDENGYWLVDELRKIDKTIAVGVLTGDSRPETIREAVRRANNYWVKPINFDSPEFLADLQKLEDICAEDRINLVHAFRSRLNLGIEQGFSIEEEPSFPVPDNIGRLIEAVYHLPSNTGDLRIGAKAGVSQVERVNLKMPYKIGQVSTVIKLYEPEEFGRQIGNYHASMRTRHWHPSTPNFWEKKTEQEEDRAKASFFGVHRVVPGTPYSHIFGIFNEVKATSKDGSLLKLIERAGDALIQVALEEAVKKHFDDRFVRPAYDDTVKRALSPEEVISVQARYARDLKGGLISLKKAAGLNFLSLEREKEYNADLAAFLGTFDGFKLIAPFNNQVYDSLVLPTLIDLSTGNIGIWFYPAVMRPSADTLIPIISALEMEGNLVKELQKRFGFFEGSNKVGKGYEGNSMAEDWAHFLNDPEINLTTDQKLLNAKKLIGVYREKLNVAPLDDILGLRIYLEMAGYRGPRKARNTFDEYMANNWEDYTRNIKTWDQAAKMDRKYFEQVKHWVGQGSWAAGLAFDLYTMLESSRRKPHIDDVIEKLSRVDMEEHSRKLTSMGMPENPGTLREKMLVRHNFIHKWYGPDKLAYIQPAPEDIRRAA